MTNLTWSKTNKFCPLFLFLQEDVDFTDKKGKFPFSVSPLLRGLQVQRNRIMEAYG